MSWLAKWRKKTLSDRIRERSPGSERSGAESCRTCCRAPVPGRAAPPEKWSQSYAPSQAVITRDKHKCWFWKGFSPRVPWDMSRRRRCLWGPPNAGKQGGIEQNHGDPSLEKSPRPRANIKQRIRDTARGSTFSGLGTRVWKNSGWWREFGTIAEHKQLDITCAQKRLWALPWKLVSYCIIHICFMMTQCLPCWIFHLSSSKTINYSPWQEMFSLPLF